MTKAARAPLPVWFHLMSLGVVVVGLLGSGGVAAIYAAFGFARLWRQAPVETIFAITAPIVVSLLWRWLALRQAWRGRLRLGVALLGLVYLLLFAQLVVMQIAA